MWWLLLAVIPHDDVIRESVDLIEQNWFYDEQGREVFQQVIFYDWSDEAQRWQVHDWRLVKTDLSEPRYDHAGKNWYVMLLDGDCIRRVEARHFRQTWLQYDPELAERENFPKEQRKLLRKAR